MNTKRFSRIITFALSMLMVIALAAPCFAAEPRAAYSPVGQGNVVLKGYGSATAKGCLNIIGSGGAYNGQRINLYTYIVGSSDQIWSVENSGINNGAYIYQSQTAGGVRLAVNALLIPVSPGVYQVTLAPTSGNTNDTNLGIGAVTGNKFQAWLKAGTAINCNLYIDSSNPTTAISDVYFFNTVKEPNSFWYWHR